MSRRKYQLALKRVTPGGYYLNGWDLAMYKVVNWELVQAWNALVAYDMAGAIYG